MGRRKDEIRDEFLRAGLFAEYMALEGVLGSELVEGYEALWQVRDTAQPVWTIMMASLVHSCSTASVFGARAGLLLLALSGVDMLYRIANRKPSDKRRVN